MVKQKDNISISKPTKFVIGIRTCGVDTCKVGYNGEFEDVNPITLSRRVIQLMGDQFTGNREYLPMYEYWLACRVLKGLEFDKERLLKDIDESDKTIQKFNMVKDKQSKEGRHGIPPQA